MNNPPRKNCVWDEDVSAWKLGTCYYMPSRTKISPWCIYDPVKDRVIVEIRDPEMLTIVEIVS
jgi:hypothetical protein